MKRSISRRDGKHPRAHRRAGESDGLDHRLDRQELAALLRELDLELFGLARRQARSLLGERPLSAGRAVGHVAPGLARPLIEIRPRGKDPLLRKLRDRLLRDAEPISQLLLSRFIRHSVERWRPIKT
jgi:hypothetical protein